MSNLAYKESDSAENKSFIQNARTAIAWGAPARVIRGGLIALTPLLKGNKPMPLPEQQEDELTIPQAEVEDDSLQACDSRDWRTYFALKLSGKGLEIGPLHRPMVRHPQMDIDYIDRFSVADLRQHYPELNELPLVEPHIIGDAETMDNVPDQKYDFLISAHVIEHMRNPLASLREWCRVVRPGGKIYLVVPDKRATFDKHRVRTTLEHIIADYQSPSRERDFEHFLDQSIHVNKKSGIEALEHARKWVAEDYSIHFHVFLPKDIVALLNWFSANIRPLKILEGPCQAPGSDEFHLLVRV